MERVFLLSLSCRSCVELSKRALHAGSCAGKRGILSCYMVILLVAMPSLAGVDLAYKWGLVRESLNFKQSDYVASASALFSFCYQQHELPIRHQLYHQYFTDYVHCHPTATIFSTSSTVSPTMSAHRPSNSYLFNYQLANFSLNQLSTSRQDYFLEVFNQSLSNLLADYN